jgi:hypothetical protein
VDTATLVAPLPFPFLFVGNEPAVEKHISYHDQNLHDLEAKKCTRIYRERDTVPEPIERIGTAVPAHGRTDPASRRDPPGSTHSLTAVVAERYRRAAMAVSVDLGELGLKLRHVLVY